MSGNHNAYQFKEGSMIKELTVRLRNPAYTGLGDIAADLIEAQAKEIEHWKLATSKNADLCREQQREIKGWKQDQKENIAVAFGLQAEVNELRAALVECQAAMTQATKPPCACFAGCDNCDLEPNANDLMRAALTRCKEVLK